MSNALYENDAAKRVIARLQRERDEARDALSKVSVNGVISGVNGDAMQLSSQGLSAELVSKVEETQEKYVPVSRADNRRKVLMVFARLSKTRRKRPVPEDWVTSESVQSFASGKPSRPLYSSVHHIAIDQSGDLVLLGGTEGTAGIYSLSQAKLQQEVETEAPIKDTLWLETAGVVATSTGAIKVLENKVVKSSLQGHNGDVTALALHPSGDILASVGIDKNCIFYDLASFSKAGQIATDSGKLSPTTILLENRISADQLRRSFHCALPS